MQNNIKSSLKQDWAINRAWELYWQRPENALLKKADAIRNQLFKNAKYISEKLEKAVTKGFFSTYLSSKEVDIQRTSMYKAGELIGILMQENHDLRMRVEELQRQVPVKKTEGKLADAVSAHKVGILEDHELVEFLNEFAKTA